MANICDIKSKSAREIYIAHSPSRVVYNTFKKCTKLSTVKFWTDRLDNEYPGYKPFLKDYGWNAKQFYDKLFTTSGDLMYFANNSPERSMIPMASNVVRVFSYQEQLLFIDIVGNLFLYIEDSRFPPKGGDLYAYAKSLKKDFKKPVLLALDIRVADVVSNDRGDYLLDIHNNLYQFKKQLILLSKNVISFSGREKTLAYVTMNNNLFLYTTVKTKLATNVKKVFISPNKDNNIDIYAISLDNNLVLIKGGKHKIMGIKASDCYVSEYQIAVSWKNRVLFYNRDNLDRRKIINMSADKFIDTEGSGEGIIYISNSTLYDSDILLPNVLDAVATAHTTYRGGFPVLFLVSKRI